MSGLLVSVSRSAICAVTLAILAFGAASVAAVVPPAKGVADEEIPAFAKIHQVPGLEEPLVPTGPTTQAEDQALRALLDAYRRQADPGRAQANRALFERFLRDHPQSAWRTAMLTNLGLDYYREGYFSQAITAWTDAWAAGRAAAEPRARALADRAVGELLRMHARLGHADELTALLADLGDRELSGQASEALAALARACGACATTPGSLTCAGRWR